MKKEWFLTDDFEITLHCLKGWEAQQISVIAEMRSSLLALERLNTKDQWENSVLHSYLDCSVQETRIAMRCRQDVWIDEESEVRFYLFESGERAFWEVHGLEDMKHPWRSEESGAGGSLRLAWTSEWGWKMTFYSLDELLIQSEKGFLDEKLKDDAFSGMARKILEEEQREQEKTQKKRRQTQTGKKQQQGNRTGMTERNDVGERPKGDVPVEEQGFPETAGGAVSASALQAEIFAWLKERQGEEKLREDLAAKRLECRKLKKQVELLQRQVSELETRISMYAMKETEDYLERYRTEREKTSYTENLGDET